MVEKVLGNPEKCQSEDCRECASLGICREIALKRFEKYKSQTIQEIESEAQENSLGSLNFEEGYSPN